MELKPLLYRNIVGALRRVLWIIASIFLFSASAWAAGDARPLRVGLPQNIFQMRHALVSDWEKYLETKLNRSVEFVNNRKFADSIMQLHMAELDFAWVADYPNLSLGYKMGLVAVPLIKGKPFFTSYLIVPISDTKTNTLLQLKGKVMVYADPVSNSHVEHRYTLMSLGEDPRGFFRKVFLTHSHRESVDAVILGLANVAEVDAFAWDAIVKNHPELGLEVRIVARSQEFGAPALVANRFVSKQEFATVQSVLIGMSQDPEGLKLLKRMNFDGFIPGEAKLYDGLIQMKKALGEP